MRLSSLTLLLSLVLLGCRGTQDPSPAEEVPPYPWAEQAWRAAIRERLHRTRVTQQYDGTPLKRILEEITRRAQVNLWVDQALFEEPKVDVAVVRAHLDDCPADEALDAVLHPLGLEWALRNEFVCVAIAKDLPPAQAKDDVAEQILQARDEVEAYERRKAAQARLENRSLIADYQDQPLASVLEDLSARTEVPIRFDAPGIAPPKGAQGVSMKGVAEVRAVSVLSHVLEMHGLGFTWRRDEVRVLSGAEAEAAAKLDLLDSQVRAKRVTIALEKVPIRELAGALEQAAGTRVLLDEATWSRQDRVTLKATDVELHQVLTRIKDEARCTTVLLHGTVFFLAPSEEPR